MQVFIYSNATKSEKPYPTTRHTDSLNYSLLLGQGLTTDTHTNQKKRKRGLPSCVVPAGPLVRAVSWQKWRTLWRPRTLGRRTAPRSSSFPHKTLPFPQHSSPLSFSTRGKAQLEPTPLLPTLSLSPIRVHQSFPSSKQKARGTRKLQLQQQCRGALSRFCRSRTRTLAAARPLLTAPRPLPLVPRPFWACLRSLGQSGKPTRLLPVNVTGGGVPTVFPGGLSRPSGRQPFHDPGAAFSRAGTSAGNRSAALPRLHPSLGGDRVHTVSFVVVRGEGGGVVASSMMLCGV